MKMLLTAFAATMILAQTNAFADASCALYVNGEVLSADKCQERPEPVQKDMYLKSMSCYAGNAVYAIMDYKVQPFLEREADTRTATLNLIFLDKFVDDTKPNNDWTVSNNAAVHIDYLASQPEVEVVINLDLIVPRTVKTWEGKELKIKCNLAE